ncbi:hypothetical protein I4F81_008896 [Pyropia yezoensis]|uniref:Uncharacterized protein n=1 Tax=Pyropia yezoensis TaxID=2788 RepID=A0ACC3C9F3_PYRYE|nr:hypothetical protein I4F81_008896 [Neopyropia yezoensis]
MTQVASTTPRQMSRIISVLFESVTKPRAIHSGLRTRPQPVRRALSIKLKHFDGPHREQGGRAERTPAPATPRTPQRRTRNASLAGRF